MVCRNSAMRRRLLVQLVLEQREQHGVHPLAVLQVRAPLDALAHVADALGVRDRTLVEAVDLQLDAVEVEVAQDVAPERARELVAEAATAKARVDGEAACLHDPVL